MGGVARRSHPPSQTGQGGHQPPRLAGGTWVPLLLVSFIAAVGRMPAVTGQLTTIPTYPVDWDAVPTIPPTSTNLTANCNCDLRQEACDLGCCCDSMCPAGLSTLFTDQGTCLPQGNEQQTLKYCVPSGYVQKVNLPSSSDFYVIAQQAAEVKFFSQLLCIVDDSNPNLGANYPDPPAGPVGDNQELAQCPAAVSPPTKSTDYRYGSTVYLQYSGSSSSVPNGTAGLQPLTIPFPAFTGLCNDETAVGFLVGTPTGSKNYYVTCQRDLSALDLASACSSAGSGGVLTPQYYSNMRFITGRGTGFAPQAPVTVAIKYLNPATGNLTSVNNTVSTYNATTGMCTNVITDLNITMYYSLSNPDASDTPGYIDAMELTFVITDVLAARSPLLQNVRVSWMETQVPQPIEVIVSGNPGYVTGFPLLAGVLASTVDATTGDTKQAVSRFVEGMPIPVPGHAGACEPTSIGNVAYGANITSTCSISLTANQLRDFCTLEGTNPAKYVQTVISSVYQSIVDNKLYVGEWGDANYTNTNEWLKVSVSGYPFGNLGYTSADNACTGVIIGFDLQIVTGVAFASNNLQQKVLYANLCFKTGVWDFPEYLPGNTSRRFYLDFSTSFIRLPQQSEEVTKPAPPLVVPLPADIFYPFVVTDGAAVDTRPAVWGMLTAAAAALTLLQLLPFRARA
ncbi:hypothetical protein CHLRE_03g181450v5 [Chlamydomonas reinhardtii]|uniref:Tectonic-1-3 N-terminal domain-containing protein n=1 Tax=Chlamydomonas reinhardtii TaxID=3055 RepID=A0A2K3DXR6_CHLRE|nr:uncharacterized protein CHLRE_03g181450v5 [Chlamydomonas reinhardtii]PNW85332.1 hypothetical protein CHLRE_03g181450v5 [Chlamydomonas reinhardtii]